MFTRFIDKLILTALLAGVAGVVCLTLATGYLLIVG